MNHDEYFAGILARLDSQGNLRRIPADSRRDNSLTDLSTNDYLGLAAKPGLQEEFFADASRRYVPMSASASRLLSACQDEYSALETLLGDLYGRPCLLFNSGYHANTGIISALAGSDTIIVADKLVHASIIDGIILSKARFTRFRHNDLDHLGRILAKETAAGGNRVIVVTESVYSMDGDRADIGALIEIKKKYPDVILYVDEAHAFGVEGPGGLGLCMAENSAAAVDVIVGTFGKACASAGAFCAVSPTIRDFLVNRARSFIFSTALPPINAAWTRFMIGKILGMDSERAALKTLGRQLQAILQPLSPAFSIEPNHIQPLVTGSAETAVALSRMLFDDGFKVLPIRTPTVPPGTERLRISLSASVDSDAIVRLGKALGRHMASLKPLLQSD